jgi:adenylosuccinate lyase
MLTYYMVEKATGLAANLVINEARARENLEVNSLGLVFSQSVLLQIIETGKTRDEAYRIVQRDARQAVESRRHLRSVLEEDDEVTLSAAELDVAFDLTRVLTHAHRSVDAVRHLAVS